MINHIFISFSAVQIYDLSYIHLHWSLLCINELIHVWLMWCIYEIIHIWTAVVDESEQWSSQCIFQFKQLERRSLKKIRASTGFEPVTSTIPVRCSTNWATVCMKPHIRSEVNLLSSYIPVRNEMMWCIYKIIHSNPWPLRYWYDALLRVVQYSDKFLHISIVLYYIQITIDKQYNTIKSIGQVWLYQLSYSVYKATHWEQGQFIKFLKFMYAHLIFCL